MIVITRCQGACTKGYLIPLLALGISKGIDSTADGTVGNGAAIVGDSGLKICCNMSSRCVAVARRDEYDEPYIDVETPLKIHLCTISCLAT